MLDSSWITGTGGSVATEVRRYELGCFLLDAPLAQVEDVARLRRSLVPSRRPVVQELVEPQFGQSCPELLQAGNNTYLRGYWQNVDYFGDAETLLRQDFVFSPAIAGEDLELARQIRESAQPAVSVHVRRSDYVTDPGARERMGTLDPEYYSRALDALGSGVGSVRQFVFTDDPNWCTENLRLNDQDVVVGATRAEAKKGAAHMHLMTLCDHHVLANSTFSWWGAWLNPSPAKIVVAPRPWLQDARWNEAGRIPADWVRIDRHAHQADQPPSTTMFAPVT
ncbi:MAG: alpha-1,2-fucosyltransferase [Actinobacteria bacterium]|nr:alpha-1,2-fucosyltransferase [Actinomycetota bacterium]